MAKQQLIKPIFVVYTFIIQLGACSSKLIMKSEPSDVRVSIAVAGSSEYKVVGKTPLELKDTQLTEILKIDPAAGVYYEAILEKDGFDKERILVPAARFMPMETVIDVKMKQGQQEMRLASQIVQYLLNAQRFATNKEYERAQIEVDKVFAIDPKFTRAMTMRASIFFIQEKYEESLNWYEKAFALDDRLEDAVLMISELKKKLGK